MILNFVLSIAEAQPRDLDRERALLVGTCLAALEEATRLSTLEVAVLLPGAVADCQAAPGATLVKVKGGRVFEWADLSHERQSAAGAHPLSR